MAFFCCINAFFSLWVWQRMEFIKQCPLDLFLPWCQKCQPHIKELCQLVYVFTLESAMKLHVGLHFLLSVWVKSSKTVDQKAAELKLPNIKEFFISLTGLFLSFSVSLSVSVHCTPSLLFLLLCLPAPFFIVSFRVSTLNKEGQLMNVYLRGVERLKETSRTTASLLLSHLNKQQSTTILA